MSLNNSVEHPLSNNSVLDAVRGGDFDKLQQLKSLSVESAKIITQSAEKYQVSRLVVNPDLMMTDNPKSIVKILSHFNGEILGSTHLSLSILKQKIENKAVN